MKHSPENPSPRELEAQIAELDACIRANWHKINHEFELVSLCAPLEAQRLLLLEDLRARAPKAPELAEVAP